MPTISSGDAEIYYESYGVGPAVVFAHGVGGNHASWYRQIPVFEREFRVIVFDHRGFGNSTDPAGAGRSRFVDDLTALLDALELDRVSLVAQSMGGGTCTGFATRAPQRVRALVLADTLVGIEEPPEIRALMADARASTEHLSQLERVLGARFRSDNPEFALLYSQIASFNQYRLRTLPGTLPDRCTPEGLAQTGIPILFVVGIEDVLFPPAAVRAVHRRTAGSSLVEISDAGHSAYFEAAPAFNAAVLAFLRSENRGQGKPPNQGQTPVL